MIITPAATAANTAGRLAIQPAQRAQPCGLVGGPELALAQRSALAPAQHEAAEEPSIAGSSVIDASTVNATAIAAATPTP